MLAGHLAQINSAKQQQQQRQQQQRIRQLNNIPEGILKKTNFGTYFSFHCILFHIYIYIPMVAGKRLRSQNEKRLQTARWVVKNIFTELRKDEKRLLSTNRLLPQGTLRRNCMKRIFGDWTMHAEGRCFTKKLAGLVCSKLRKKFGMETSEVENDRMLTMLKLGRKHRVKKPKMSCMDNLDTLPLACVSDRPCQATF